MIIQIRHGDAWKSYPLVDLHSFTQKLTLTQLAAFNRELAVSNISSARSLSDVLGILREIGADSLSTSALMDHPEGVFILAVLIWGARTSAGERLGLLDAADFSLEDLRFIPEPSEDPEPEGKAQAGDPSA